MKPGFQQVMLDILEDRRRDGKARCIAKVLWVLSKAYGLAVQTRHFLYRHGLLRRKTLGCVIVSVGNLTVGGTGKTPVVELLARALRQGGRRVAILSRGYKRKKRAWLRTVQVKGLAYQPCIVSDGKDVLVGSEEAGDEPYMLAKNLQGVAVLVDKNRVKSGSYAIEKMRADTLVLDDGFQYLPLGRRVDIALVDATNPFGNGQLLPRGILREPLKNLARADMIFLTKSDGVDTAPIVAGIRRHNQKAPVVQCSHESKHLTEVATGTVKPLEFLKGKRVAVLTAIASPQSFEKAVAGLGAHVVTALRFPDHHRFTEKDISGLLKEMGRQNVEALIITEKDAVRFPAMPKKNLPVYFLRVEIRIGEGMLDFNDCIARLCGAGG